MECNCNGWNIYPPRPHMQNPPCMNTDCRNSYSDNGMPLRPIPRAAYPAGSEGAIAMGYVPCQQWEQTYPLEQSLNRGTIFPELDLPFVMGRCRG